jgi:hypothetical protein
MTEPIRARLQKQIAAAQAYRDAALNWDLWGPWPWWR